MNNESPLIPQGSLLEQKNKGRTRIRIAVFVVLAIHGIGLLALLMQGCQKQPETTSANPPVPTNEAPATSSAPPPFEPGSNTVVAPETNPLPPVAQTNPVTTPTPPAPIEPAPTAPVAGVGTEYKIVKGDTFGKLARKFHVSTKAITDANPGVDPAKLKIGQTIRIPAASTSAPSPTGTSATGGNAAAGGAETPSSQSTYTVKSGDTLTRIAGQYGTTVKAIRAANGLKTHSIRVGQKLKIPVKATASAPAAGASSTPVPPPVMSGPGTDSTGSAPAPGTTSGR